MRNTDRFISIYRKLTLLFPVLAVLTAVSSVLAFSAGFNTSLGYFDRGAWFTVFAVLTVLSAAAAAFLALLSKKTELTVTDVTNPFTLFSRLLAAASALVIFVKFIASLIRGDRIKVFGAVSAVLMLFTACAFILSVFPSAKKRTFTTAAWILAALSVNIDIFVRYFDFSTAVNSDMRYMITVAECAALLFMLSECRLSFDRKYELATSPFFVVTNCFAASGAVGIAAGLLWFGFSRGISSGYAFPFPWILLFIAAGLSAADRMLSAYRR